MRIGPLGPTQRIQMGDYESIEVSCPLEAELITAGEEHFLNLNGELFPVSKGVKGIVEAHEKLMSIASILWNRQFKLEVMRVEARRSKSGQKPPAIKSDVYDK